MTARRSGTSSPQDDEHTRGIKAIERVRERTEDLVRWIEGSHRIVDHFVETMNILLRAGSLDAAQELCETLASERDSFFESTHPEIDNLLQRFQQEINESRTRTIPHHYSAKDHPL